MIADTRSRLERFKGHGWDLVLLMIVITVIIYVFALGGMYTVVGGL